ncbi:hypothetical protein BLNAU_11161 [Blattamonas nauphoetae]|uniref:Uncharacterized protein n=1 Tax=Blattamonas nauphoetae TaxID=2049346 RepID=A0ABQ9XNA3_9EUKA|nr:hypothetical protein BLNAU_11161 [Blattamonas nauphoetae]
MLEIKTNGLIDILPFQSISGLIVEFESGSDITPLSVSSENERRTQAGEWSEWETAEIKRITHQKAAAMDNEEDKEEEQTEILAEDDFEGEQSEEEPSPVPTIHRALASRRNTSSPTQHPPQPQTPRNSLFLPLNPCRPFSYPRLRHHSISRSCCDILPSPHRQCLFRSLLAPPVPPYLNDALLDAIRPESRTTSCTEPRHQQSHDITPPSYPIAVIPHLTMSHL